MTTILTLVGSLRSDSTNRRIAEAAAHHAPAGVELPIYDEIATMPFYNEDLDVAGAVPAPVVAFREALAAADALLIVMPSYNGTIPAVVKNAIDWASRPYGEGAASGKPAAVVGTALGALGGAPAHDEARRSLGIAGAVVVEELEMSVAGSTVRFAEVDPRDDDEIRSQLASVVDGLVASIAVPVGA